jgi:uncharacterized protein (DUF488 family)
MRSAELVWTGKARLPLAAWRLQLMRAVVVFTIGHSVHTADAFVGLLQAHGVALVADVRTVPRSRRHPQFSLDELARRLAADGVGYRHFPDLGGLRKPRRDSANTGWTHPSFRGYADHMGTPAFQAALDELLRAAEATPTAVMCAEAKWWQCHRRLLADALAARGAIVRHIMSARAADLHEMTPFGRVEGAAVSYPGLI